ncbi:TIGR03435 family protein [Silvibacterium sp.]|uniref:TIGR03435 family protein n=1 Tax=Silvibacterium sp. TaxID=1964179 RepID=UPI0039E2E21B
MLLSGSPLIAQTIVGTWQGKLPVQQDPRIVLQVTQSGNGPLGGTLKFIDHDDVAAPLLSLSFASPTVTFTVGDISYLGKLSEDSKSITGLWTRGTQKYPLSFMLASPDDTWKYAGASRLTYMPANADPSFEVATIKLSRPDSDNAQATDETRFRTFEAKNSSVIDLVRFAYHLSPRQVQGGPSWAKEVRFDVVGQPDIDGLPDADQHRLMMRKLLADRFHLVVHDTYPTFPIYALTAADPNVKVMPIAANDHGETKIVVRDNQDGTTTWQLVFMTIPEFDDILMRFIKNRQIVDETDMAGQFNITLTLPSEVMNDPTADEGALGSAFFKAVQVIGFQLKSKSEPLRVVVIDEVEKPTPN